MRLGQCLPCRSIRASGRSLPRVMVPVGLAIHPHRRMGQLFGQRGRKIVAKGVVRRGLADAEIRDLRARFLLWLGQVGAHRPPASGWHETAAPRPRHAPKAPALPGSGGGACGSLRWLRHRPKRHHPAGQAHRPGLRTRHITAAGKDIAPLRALDRAPGILRHHQRATTRQPRLARPARDGLGPRPATDPPSPAAPSRPGGRGLGQVQHLKEHEGRVVTQQVRNQPRMHCAPVPYRLRRHRGLRNRAPRRSVRPRWTDRHARSGLQTRIAQPPHRPAAPGQTPAPAPETPRSRCAARRVHAPPADRPHSNRRAVMPDLARGDDRWASRKAHGRSRARASRAPLNLGLIISGDQRGRRA